jgi:hypothetical protein
MLERRLSQKEKERLFLRHFMELSGPELAITAVEEREAPDFLLQLGEGLIGVEINEVFRDQEGAVPMQAQEGGWHAVAQGCESGWANRRRPNIEVWLGFHGSSHVGKKRVPAVVERVLKLVDDTLPAEGDEVHVDSLSLPFGEFPTELRYFRISRLVPYERSYWHVDGPGTWVPQLTTGKLQEVIASKEDYVAGYRKACPEVWLLVVLHGWRGSSMMDVPAEVVGAQYRSAFDRVFLLDTLKEQVHELRCP